ncbi:hypothetical protein ASE66_13620 [Bosea sp. Root483D1]|uniref:phosphotransferase enzyme family protein n=1 Tax=Bosea sp. Root483D1 TaxID=1736544 RepID=UPI00071119E4|nr:phosphotransferase [Bosea sp. Root483D1]KRE14414.1 hypothetical protein ASE66_13620 [Bosea sp. Root483D1]
MTALPPHSGFAPRPLAYKPAPDHLAGMIAAVMAATEIEQADVPVSPPRGYYRATDRGGKPVFIKIVDARRAEILASANEIVAKLAARAVPTITCIHGPSTLETGDVLFAYRWADGSFGEPTPPQLKSLGRAIVRMHGALAAVNIDTTLRDWSSSHRTMLEAAAEDTANSGFERQAARDLLDRWGDFVRALTDDAQPIHNDLHPGNVLFEGHEVSAFLDFEETMSGPLSPIVDLHWVWERWCLLRLDPNQALTAALTFLDAYLDAGGRKLAPPPGTLGLISRWRSLIGIATLESARRPDLPAWVRERRKFQSLLERAGEWQESFAMLEARLR